MHYNTIGIQWLNTSISARLQRIHVGDYYVCCSALHGTCSCLQWVLYKQYNNIPVTRCRPLTCSIVMTKYQSEHARHVSLKGPLLLLTNLKPNAKLLSTHVNYAAKQVHICVPPAHTATFQVTTNVLCLTLKKKTDLYSWLCFEIYSHGIYSSTYICTYAFVMM